MSEPRGKWNCYGTAVWRLWHHNDKSFWASVWRIDSGVWRWETYRIGGERQDFGTEPSRKLAMDAAEKALARDGREEAATKHTRGES